MWKLKIIPPPLSYIIELIRNLQNININIKCLSTRMVYYEAHLQDYQALIKVQTEEKRGFDENYLVINVRGAEIFQRVHRYYVPIPLSFYDQIIRETGLVPVFVGQLGDDPYSNCLREKFPDALYPKFSTWEDDFNTIRGSVNIIPAVSTFSWLATWLSESAQNIYFPIMGMYHPKARPDVDMLPVYDRRYHFYLSNLLSWGAPEEREKTLNTLMFDEVYFERLNGMDWVNKLPESVGTEGLNIKGPILAR